MALKSSHRRDQKHVAAEHDALEGHGLLQLEQADAAIELERIVPYIANRLTFRLNRLLKQAQKIPLVGLHEQTRLLTTTVGPRL